MSRSGLIPKITSSRKMMTDKRLAELLTRLGVRATFKIVGEKARVLEQRSTDRRHCRAEAPRYRLSQQHAQPAADHRGLSAECRMGERTRRVLPARDGGRRDVERIFGVTPVAYGQPGSAWAPQAYPALRDMGIRMYLDEADHVGIDDQPFFYGGMLNVFKMRSNLARMDLERRDQPCRRESEIHQRL